MYPESGIFTSQRLTRWVADKSSVGNPGNEMPSKERYRRRGADPPKNELGKTDMYGKPSIDRDSAASSGNGTCIAVPSFSI
jgi:hypothetical protein